MMDWRRLKKSIWGELIPSRAAATRRSRIISSFEYLRAVAHGLQIQKADGRFDTESKRRVFIRVFAVALRGSDFLAIGRE